MEHEVSTPSDPVPSFTLPMFGADPEGATPVDEDDLVDLLPAFVATRADLNVVEFDNITKSMPWALDRARKGGPKVVLDTTFLFTLHRRMFEDVWRWAGAPRRRITNIGIDPSQIMVQTKQSLDDALFWHDNDVFGVDERAARIHWRLVAVHPFPNGNGRCTRLLADLYLTSIDQPMFTWGAGGSIDANGDARRRYHEALRAADAEDYAPLVAFARG